MANYGRGTHGATGRDRKSRYSAKTKKKSFSSNEAMYAGSSSRRINSSPHGAGNMRDYSRQASQQSYSNARRRKSRRRKIFSITLSTVLVLALTLVAGAWAYVRSIDAEIQSGTGDLSGVLTDVAEPEDPYYILLMGTDGRSGQTSYRCDTIVLARIDPADKSVTLISIPRDTMIELGEYGTQKINAAHAFGGAALAVSTVSEFAGVDIAHYVEVDFSGFEDIVDAIGGVEVDVPCEIDDSKAGDVVIEPGLQILDGEAALTFCRSRHFALGDFTRAEHQQLFLKALASKLLNDTDAATLATTLDDVADCITTDMSVSEILALADDFRGMDTDSIKAATVPSTTDTIDGISYVITDEDAWATMMDRVDQGLSPEASEEETSTSSEDTSNE